MRIKLEGLIVQSRLGCEEFAAKGNQQHGNAIDFLGAVCIGESFPVVLCNYL